MCYKHGIHKTSNIGPFYVSKLGSIEVNSIRYYPHFHAMLICFRYKHKASILESRKFSIENFHIPFSPIFNFAIKRSVFSFCRVRINVFHMHFLSV